MLPRDHATTPTVSVSSLTTTAWWPMPACSCRPPSPGIWAWGNSLTITLTWAARRAGQHRGQNDDAGGLRAVGRRLHRRRRCVAHRGDDLHSGRHGQGAIHPGHLPAQLPVGPRPPARPGEPGAAGAAWQAGAGPGDAPFTIDLDSTICETSH